MATKSSLVRNNGWNSILQWIKIGDNRYQYLGNELINQIYPRLAQGDKLLLLDGLVKVINMLYLKFGFSQNQDLFWKQLLQNNLLDIRALLNLLLPYIKDDVNDEKKRKLKSLEDLYLQKNERGQFVYTDSQYNRCVRYSKDDKIYTINRPYRKEYFEQHLELLLMSIETLSNKLYINWTDILPIRMDRYQNMLLYQDTVKKIIGRIETDSHGIKTVIRDEPIVQIGLINNYIDPNPGISYQDCYNVMSNHLYHEIKNHKWIIYDIMVDNKPTTYLNFLEKRFNLENIWKNLLWSQLDVNKQNQFRLQWRNFLDSLDTSDNTILHHFYFFFSKYHRNATNLIKQKKLVLDHEPTEEDEEAEENIKITPMTTQNAKKGMNSVPVDEIYLFFYDQLTAFQRSWFYYLVKIKKINYLGNSDDIYVTPKNIYNYCKSLVHYTNKNGKYLEMPKLWYSLKPNFIEMVLIRMLDIPGPNNDWTKPNWFNINNYLKKIYPNLPNDRLLITNKLIHQTIRTYLVDIIFESLIYHGLLSEFRPNPSITNDQIAGGSANKTQYRYDQMKKQYFSGKNGESFRKDAYYYLTGKVYDEIKPICLGGSKREYFDYLTSDQIWTFTYAMNWISQINFYHHYLNDRIIYITGATGVGKSTQIPKLLLYSQKMLDYNFNGKIICTQPRIPPTEENADTISRELGVPIRTCNELYGKNVFTGNYYVQFKHSEASHIATKGSFLRIVTDGTLYGEMKRSPFLTRSSPDPYATDNSGHPLEWMQTYKYGNKYDCIIVDEAHEHNANMDMILTLARDSIYVNNSLKLVIISATMEDDEPIYRRYYRRINDNRSYPLSAFIETNILDRANMDRRIHISPPGGTTQYPIKDIYLSKSESDLINDDNFLEFSIKKTIQLANSTIEKDILLFVTGIADIQKATKEINANTASNIIALGFYGKQSEEEKAMIVKIHQTLPLYTRYKEDIFLEEKNITRHVAPGTYNRAIIIATNVAEASLTLQNLGYVVDSGYAKMVVFEPLEGLTKELILPISYSSSVQRRGRVGRVAPGEVYHMYDLEKVINNKTTYKIADEDIKGHLVSLIKSDLDDIFIITSDNDINNIQNLQIIMAKKETSQTINEEYMYSLLGNPRPYLDIIKKQYLYVPDLTDISQYYTYYGKTDMKDYSIGDLRNNFLQYVIANHDDYQYQKYEIFLSRAETGYDDFILEDRDLTFYLIHPDENVIVRNLFTGQMVGIKCSPLVSNGYYYYLLKNNNINITKENIQECHFGHFDFQNFVLPKYYLTMDDAKLQLLVIDIRVVAKDIGIQYTNVTSPNIRKYIKSYYAGIPERIYANTIVTIKSTILVNFQNIGTITDLSMLDNINHLFWYCYALPYNLESDVLAIIILINTVPDLKQWIGTVHSRRDVEKFFSMHINGQGDIYFLWKLWNDIKEILEKENIFPKTMIDISVKNNFERYKHQYLDNVKIPFDQFLVLDKMYKLGQLNSNDEFYYYISYSTFDSKKLANEDTIKKYLQILANNHKLDEEKLINFLSDYLDALFIQNQKTWLYQYWFENKMEEEIDILDWAKKKLLFPTMITNPNYQPTTWDTLLETYIRAFSANLLKNEFSYYLRLSKGVRMDPDYWSKRLALEKTFLNNKMDYLVYHNTETSEHISAVYLTPVKLEWVLNLNPIYYYYFFFDKNNALYTMEKDEDTIRAINLIESNKHLFSRNALLAYLDQLGNPHISAQLRLDLT